MQANILVVGSINMDLTMRIDSFPKDGETVLGASYAYVPGGKGANQAVAAAKLGACSRLCARVGEDAQGAALLNSLSKDGVDSSSVLADACSATGLAVIPVDKYGHNRIMVFPGANNKLTMQNVREALSHPTDAVILQLEIPLDVVYATLSLANEHGIKTVLDAGPAQSIALERLRGVDIVSPNESETEALIGVYPADESMAREAAAKLLAASGAKNVVLKLGERGAFLMGEAAREGCLIPAHKIQAIDTTAAGDCFTAAMTLKWIETGNLLESAKYANAAAALSATRYGAQPSMPTAAEVDAFLSNA